MKEPIALGEFAGPMQNNDKTDHDTVKVYRNVMRVINEIATKPKMEKYQGFLLFYFTKESFILKHSLLLIIILTSEHATA